MTIYLITGANRGIGRGLVTAYLSKPNNTIIATVRDPSHPTAKSLDDLPKGLDTTLIILTLDSASTSSITSAFTTLRTTHDIQHLDVIIANAGASAPYVPVLSIDCQNLREVTDINVVGALALFQGALPLMKGECPKFVAISAALGSISNIAKFPMSSGSYGLSKAMLNFMMAKIHAENEGVVSVPIHPGFVQTDMGQTGADYLGVKLDQAAITVKESVNGMVKLIDEATRENYSGKFMSWDGEELPW